MAERFAVEVVYALADRQTRIALELAPGTSIRQAVLQSGMLDLHPELSRSEPVLGIHGRIRAAGELVRSGDRVEIYRPLTVDPKDSRRQRARDTRKASRGR